jgi:hypothetical protein
MSVGEFITDTVKKTNRTREQILKELSRLQEQRADSFADIIRKFEEVNQGGAWEDDDDDDD